MNRQQRRQKQKQERRIQKAGAFQLDMEALTPWADVLMKIKLPEAVVEGMLEITDKVLQDPDRKNWGDNLAGQIADEPIVPHQMMMDYKLDGGGTIFQFFMNIVGEYVKHCTAQQATQSNYDKVKDIEWLTQMKSCWIISQWEGEYNPLHVHTECSLSTVHYLKVPDWLPSIKPDRDDDGNVVFIGQEGIGRLTRKIIKHKPEVGDMFVFPSHLFHTVYPFKTDGDYERRSCSFNADFINRAEYEQQQEMMKQQQQQQQPPPAPLPGAPEKLTINTEV